MNKSAGPVFFKTVKRPIAAIEMKDLPIIRVGGIRNDGRVAFHFDDATAVPLLLSLIVHRN